MNKPTPEASAAAGSTLAVGSALPQIPARDNIPLDHPRRIARIAYAPAHTLARESPEVQRLCAEHREKEAKRHAALVASGYYGTPNGSAQP